MFDLEENGQGQWSGYSLMPFEASCRQTRCCVRLESYSRLQSRAGRWVIKWRCAARTAEWYACASDTTMIRWSPSSSSPSRTSISRGRTSSNWRRYAYTWIYFTIAEGVVVFFFLEVPYIYIYIYISPLSLLYIYIYIYINDYLRMKYCEIKLSRRLWGRNRVIWQLRIITICSRQNWE